jgi:transposase
MNEYKTQTIEHLGLVSAMIDELGIVESIDKAIKQDKNERKVTIGEAVKAMLLNGLGFANRQLYLVPQFFENKPLDILIKKGIEPNNLNDSVLGRALESLYEYGVTPLFSLISQKALENLDLIPKYHHLDSTAIHVDGKYNSEEEKKEGVVHITKGYSKDHRPDLNQVMLEMICENSHGIPVAMRALDGNSSDKISFEKMVIDHIESLSKTTTGTVVADSAIYTANNLKSFQNNNIKWITRVPNQIKENKELIELIDKQRMTPHSKDERYSYLFLGNSYADVNQHLVVVHSTPAKERAKKSVSRKLEKLVDKEIKEFNSLKSTLFACENDANRALEKLVKKFSLLELNDTKIVKHKRYKKAGQPKKNQEPDFYEYSIESNYSFKIEPYYQEVWKKSLFTLATNDLNIEPQKIIDAYKNQFVVEKGFRFIKSPEFLANSLYIKKPERVEALLFIMTLCLMVYASLEMKIRSSLKENNEFFIDQKGKPTQTPTARWVFQTFTDIHILSIGNIQQIVMNLKDYHHTLLRILGESYRINYLLV